VGEGAGRQGRGGVDRLTVQEAARRLGVSEAAIRKRVTRGTLEHAEGEDGRVYVYLDTGVDAGVDEGIHPEQSTLISEMRDRIDFLERELEARREELQRRDVIILNMSETMKALPSPASQETPAETPGAPETAADEQQGRGQAPDAGGAQEPAEPRSWWRRMFGG
jgi:hypothetical protein